MEGDETGMETNATAASYLTGAGLPPWLRVLAVVAHPDDESFGLGAILDAFALTGARVEVMCLTHGEASTLGADADLGVVRESELAAAAATLGLTHATIYDHPDGGLGRLDPVLLAEEVARMARQLAIEGMVVFDANGVTGHGDHIAATAAAVTAGERHGLPVLAWSVTVEVAEAINTEFGSGLLGRPASELDIALPVDRARQMSAARAHVSQAVPTSILWRRLELTGPVEHLRWLRRSAGPLGGGRAG